MAQLIKVNEKGSAYIDPIPREGKLAIYEQYATKLLSEGLHRNHEADMWAAGSTLRGGKAGDFLAGGVARAARGAISAQAFHAMSLGDCFVARYFRSHRFSEHTTFRAFGSYRYFLGDLIITTCANKLSGLVRIF